MFFVGGVEVLSFLIYVSWTVFVLSRYYVLVFSVSLYLGGLREASECRRVFVGVSFWFLKRSCLCYFRLICDEINMVYFFFGIKFYFEEIFGFIGILGKGFGVFTFMVCTWGICFFRLCVGGFGGVRWLVMFCLIIGSVYF